MEYELYTFLRCSASVIWYSDVDGDGYGDVNNAFACARNATTDVQNSQDCNDGDGTVYPGAPEDWDCLDTNCDGFAYPLGDGRDGALNVSGTTTFTPSSTTVSGGLSIGQTQVSVSNGSVFSAGDYVLFWDAYGNSAGQWSIEYIESVSNNTLTLASAHTRDCCSE